MAIRSGSQGAYAPPANVLQVLEAYRSRSLQRPLTETVLVRAGVPETVAKRTINSMVVLELIDEAGNPTNMMEGLRLAPSGEYQARLKEMVEGAYADILSFANPATDPPDRILDAFRGVEPRGQMRRMVTLFLGLAEAAGMIPDGAPAKPGAKAPTRNRSRPRENLGPAITPEGMEMLRRTGPRTGSRKARFPATEGQGLVPLELRGLFASLPPEGEGWSQARRDKFVETFEAVLDLVVPIRDDDETEEGRD